ncbi:alpha/beta hydrolase [Bacteriovoracaceae bacterium]|nr:alpha/beta hydrolase [Bacteriovoracaceae bacterium]
MKMIGTLRLTLIFTLLTYSFLQAEITLPEDVAKPEECLSYIKNTVIPRSFEYGWVDNYENYKTKSGRVLKIFYAYKKGDENIFPVAWQNGGPGSANRGWSMMSSSLPNTSLVFIDQRGQGCSSRLPQFNALGKRKRKKIKSRLRRFQLYLSRGIVHDMEEVRKKLFGENAQWVVSGQSFGSMITQRYVSLFPQSLAAAHGHGFGAIKNSTYFAKKRVISHIEQMDKYFEKYPEDKALLLRMKQKIKKKFCVNISSEKNANDIIVSYCGKYIIDIPGLILTAFPSWHPRFHDYLQTNFHPGVMFDKKSFKKCIKGIWSILGSKCTRPLWWSRFIKYCF